MDTCEQVVGKVQLCQDIQAKERLQVQAAVTTSSRISYQRSNWRSIRSDSILYIKTILDNLAPSLVSYINFIERIQQYRYFIHLLMLFLDRDNTLSFGTTEKYLAGILVTRLPSRWSSSSLG